MSTPEYLETVKIRYTEYCQEDPSTQRSTVIETPKYVADWILKVNPDGTPFGTSEELQEGLERYRRLSDENREID